jgi:hypothetical protein
MLGGNADPLYCEVGPIDQDEKWILGLLGDCRHTVISSKGRDIGGL